MATKVSPHTVCECGSSVWIYRRVYRDTPYPWRDENRIHRTTWPWTHGLLAICQTCHRTYFGSTVIPFFDDLLTRLGDDREMMIRWIHGVPIREPMPVTRVTGHKRGQP